MGLNLNTVDLETGEHVSQQLNDQNLQSAKVVEFTSRVPTPGTHEAANLDLLVSGGQVSIKKVPVRRKSTASRGYRVPAPVIAY